MTASLPSSATLSSFALLAALAGCSGGVFVGPAQGNGGAATTTTPSSTETSPSGGTGGVASTTTTSVGGGTTTTTSSTTTSTTTTSTPPPPCDPATVDHDPNHCGACGHSCLGGDCIAGACQPVQLHAEADEPRGLCLYMDDVYWFTAAGFIARVPKQGGNKKVLGGAPDVSRILVDAGLVYWSEYMGLSSASSIPIDGGPATVIGFIGPGGGSLALDDTYVYWSVFDTASKHVLMKSPRAGGPMSPVSPALGSFAGVEMNDGYLYWIDRTSQLGMPPPIAAGGIRRAKANVGPIETVITSHDVNSIVFDQTHVYWVHSGTYDSSGWSGSAIRRAPKGGGPDEVIVNLPKDAFAFGLAVDDTNVYWVSYDGHAVNKADKHGGPTIKMADAGNPLALVVDDVAVYWIDPTLGEVNKIAK